MASSRQYKQEDWVYLYECFWCRKFYPKEMFRRRRDCSFWLLTKCKSCERKNMNNVPLDEIPVTTKKKKASAKEIVIEKTDEIIVEAESAKASNDQNDRWWKSERETRHYLYNLIKDSEEEFIKWQIVYVDQQLQTLNDDRIRKWIYNRVHNRFNQMRKDEVEMIMVLNTMINELENRTNETTANNLLNESIDNALTIEVDKYIEAVLNLYN